MRGLVLVRSDVNMQLYLITVLTQRMVLPGVGSDPPHPPQPRVCYAICLRTSYALPGY